MKADAAPRILVFRFGSIGDMVVALPCFHLIRKCHPRARIALLTNRPGIRAAPAESVLDGIGLVDEYIDYPGGTRRLHDVLDLRRRIQSFGPDKLIYLAPPRGPLSNWRDHLFFRWCGCPRIVGLPLNPFAQATTAPSEPEARRLARQVHALGEVDVTQVENWDLHLSPPEMAQADEIVRAGLPTEKGSLQFIGLSVGTKQSINDWGDANWRAVLAGLAHLNVGLVLVGDAEDRERSQKLAQGWPGPVLNLCGQLPPRLSAAVLRNAMLFLCHDSGPMHLAAAVRTRCVAVFSRKNPFGKWYPFGRGHRVLYPRDAGIQSIAPREVIDAAMETLRASAPAS